ncbi:MAG TPA: hypothetical protein EYN82_07285 [Candidatus Marinimicrobia bacterium]|jgi:hypothetical protein|nr:hypothetical protein [Candidatus Neomarinimicrobiota bacterium]HIB29553.1 hypothetical protein [Candidatus Neomarinimicrobiota bacterium]HIN96305.1 hypothetical protein [Candidatus Neomarinimicrobiota bacterium]
MKIIDLNISTRTEVESISVGDSIIINEAEWTVAEDLGTTLTLYGEDVDGKIQTQELEFQKLINQAD